MVKYFTPGVLWVLLSGCGQSSNPAVVTPPQTIDPCGVNAQKQFVLDSMRDIYFWNELLPADVELDTYATPEALLADLTKVQPLDNFSFIAPFAEDAQFFAAGQYAGFGFSIRVGEQNELHLTSVYASGPAAVAGLARGQEVIAMNGRSITTIEANEGIDAVLDLPTIEFTMRRPVGTEFVVTLNRGLVTIDPIPQWRVIGLSGGTTVGYLELTSFVGTANAAFATVFADFAAAGVTDIILDLRYNGGGRVDTTELLGDYLGGFANAGQVFSKTRFNADNAIGNRTAVFGNPANAVNLSSLVVIATGETASASELITNSMFPYASVTIVGGTTLGKPVGQLGLQFCDKILRPTAFETLNANDEGAYYAGLPANCPVVDDLEIPVGAAADPNLQAALFFLDNGACPVAATGTSDAFKYSSASIRGRADGPAWRRLANAW